MRLAVSVRLAIDREVAVADFEPTTAEPAEAEEREGWDGVSRSTPSVFCGASKLPIDMSDFRPSLTADVHSVEVGAPSEHHDDLIRCIFMTPLL